MIRHRLSVATFVLSLVSIAACSNDGANNDAGAPANEDLSVDAATAADSQAKLDEMLVVLDSSDEEAARLKAVFARRERALTGWWSAHGGDLTDLERQLAAAARDRNLAEVQRIKDQAQPLRDEFRGLIDAQELAVLAALSPASRTKWEAHRLAARLLKLMSPLNLSGEQTDAIRAEAVAAAQAAAAETLPQAAGFQRLEWAVESRVLTADQSRAYEAIKKKNQLRSLQDN